MIKLNCMLIDDDSVSKKVLEKMVDRVEYLTVSHSLDNAKDALKILKDSDNDVDIILLDIEMPEMSGMDVLKSLSTAYNVIVITGNKQYAIKAFDESVADFLVKPVNQERFVQAVNKVKREIEKNKLIAEYDDHIAIKSDGRIYVLKYDDIFFVETLSDYVIFNTEKSRYIVHHTMKGVEKRLPGSKFSRVHRSFIVNRDKILKIADLQIEIGGKLFPIGAHYKDTFMSKFNLL